MTTSMPACAAFCWNTRPQVGCRKGHRVVQVQSLTKDEVRNGTSSPQTQACAVQTLQMWSIRCSCSSSQARHLVREGPGQVLEVGVLEEGGWHHLNPVADALNHNGPDLFTYIPVPVNQHSLHKSVIVFYLCLILTACKAEQAAGTDQPKVYQLQTDNGPGHASRHAFRWTRNEGSLASPDA